MLPQPATSSVSPRHLSLQKWRGRVGMGLVASLSVLAGMTDAIGFMATGDFVSFMSGNTTRLAVAISDGDLSVMVRLTLAILAFIAGNALGVVVARLGGRRALPLLLGIATLLCGCRMATGKQHARADLGDSGNGHAQRCRRAGQRAAGRSDLRDRCAVAFRSWPGALDAGERRDGWRVQLVPWVGMFIGAVIGALLEHRLGLNALLISGSLSALLGLVSLKIPHRWQRQYMPR